MPSSKLIKTEFKLSDLLYDAHEVAEYLQTLELQVAVEGPQGLGYCQRALMQVFRAQQSVQTGNLRDFYEAYGDPLEAVAAFTELGLTEAASAMELSMEAFPPGMLNGDHQEIIDWMNENAWALEEQWYPLGLVILNLSIPEPGDDYESTELMSAARNYFMENAEALGLKR
jgi:hypothetical protein